MPHRVQLVTSNKTEIISLAESIYFRYVFHCQRTMKRLHHRVGRGVSLSVSRLSKTFKPSSSSVFSAFPSLGVSSMACCWQLIACSRSEYCFMRSNRARNEEARPARNRGLSVCVPGVSLTAWDWYVMADMRSGSSPRLEIAPVPWAGTLLPILPGGGKFSDSYLGLLVRRQIARQTQYSIHSESHLMYNNT
jgi:hypothetical protein